MNFTIKKALVLLLVLVGAFCIFQSVMAKSKSEVTVIIKPDEPVAPVTPVVTKDKNRVEVVFVLDTTGSMSGLIEGAKRKIWSIANIIIDQNPNAEIYMGLVGYRDIDDEYVTKAYPLTKDIQDIYSKLLEFKASGGGDTPESVNEALDVAVTKSGWSKTGVKSDRIIFLVGDAPPHMDYKQDRKYSEVIKEALQRGIIVNTVQAGDMESTTKFWREIALLGKGEYMAIPQDGGKVTIIVTPYDKQITEIQIKINSTIIPYGSVAQQRTVTSKVKMYETMSAPESADMSSYMNKNEGGKNVVTGAGDMVADFKGKADAMKKVAKEDLPSNMQKMSEKEREDYVNKQSAEREKLSNDLKELIKKRDKYVAEEQAKQKAGKPADSFDESVSGTLKKQIK